MTAVISGPSIYTLIFDGFERTIIVTARAYPVGIIEPYLYYDHVASNLLHDLD